ncbi:hypothetical protein [Nitrosophilus kaiyonis]|uniref:hypothetical protein n=1 Tax=Nitrosophilus kaiyonis TaxID=2930200 RepID=UPI0024901114|nr:hypothetical protein [Nitrosophilus kaiyonis]
MIKKIFYSIDAFKTKQVLDNSYKKYSQSFQYNTWTGEFNKEFNLEDIKKIILNFEEKKDFTLVHKSDYRYTFYNKELKIYLKLYKIYESKYSKTTIYKRNILRRTLAKKAFSLYFILKDLNIPSIVPIFYAFKNDKYIPSKSIYISQEEKDSFTLDFIFQKLSQKGDKGSYAEDFFNDSKIYDLDIDKLIYNYGNMLRKILDNGIHIFYKELFANTLCNDKEELKLCDLDIVNAISKYNDYEKIKEFEKHKNYLKHISNSLKLPINLETFENGYFNE